MGHIARLISFLFNINALGWDLPWIANTDKIDKPSIGKADINIDINADKADNTGTNIADINRDKIADDLA